jgi:metallo-beta-lactamase family protein
MKIRFLGAAGTVTGSSYVLTSGSGQSILIDLGMFQGPDEIDKLNYEPFAYDCRNLAGAVLTHAHLDHCGRLPILLQHGFTGSIWMTSPTADLTELSLLDTAKIAKDDKKQILFNKDQAIQTIQTFKSVYYRTPQRIGDFTVTFRDAGHIMGSAILEIVDEKPDSDIRTIVFSGDLGNSPDDLLHEIEHVDKADAVVMESTYGDRLHPDANASDTIAAEIKEVEKTGGTLLIPAFSLHRTQELMHMILHLKKQGIVRETTPVYMDSPMANTATRIYMSYPGEFNTHVQEEVRTSSPFVFPGMIIVGHGNQSRAIHKHEGAKVIIAGSGMMTGGRILRHAMEYLGNPSTRLLLVGYQGEETLGRELKEGNRSVIIDGHTVNVKATVTQTLSMSSHADQGQLLEWLGVIKQVRKVFLTHGEDGPRATLAAKISKDLGIGDVSLPQLHEEITL